LFYGGGGGLLGNQALAVLCVGVFSFVVTVLIALGIHAAIGLRVNEDEERIGLDLTLHEENAYDLEAAGGGRVIGEGGHW